MHLQLNPTRSFRVLLLGIVVLIAADIGGKFIGHVAPDARDWVRIVKLDREASIATWVKSAELAACALFLAGIAIFKRRERDEFRHHWLGLAIVFALLSIEEIICIHESISAPLQRLLHTNGPLYFAWIIPGALFVAVLGFLYWRFILRFPRDLRLSLIASGVLYVGGVLGMESLAGWWTSQHGTRNFVYAIETIAEEGMQLLGALVFLNVLMRYAARLPLEFSLKATPNPVTTSPRLRIMPELETQLRPSRSPLERWWAVPIAIAAISCVLAAIPITRPLAYWMIVENHPVELLTFILLFAGGFIGMKLATGIRAAGWVRAFYLIFSLGLLVTAMEEIAWGQQFLGFATPESFSRINAQGETTLHNIKGMQGRTEVFRLAFSYAGLAGILLARKSGQWFRRIAPHGSLLPWFLVIAAFESVNAFNDVFPIQESFDHFVSRFSEVTELLIAATGLLYVWQKCNDERIVDPQLPTFATDAAGKRQAA